LAKLTITPSDHLKGKLVEPGVYLAVVKKVDESNSKTDQSQNWNVEFQITQEGTYKGVPVYKTFNEKGAGFAITFVEACGGKINPKEDYDLDFQKTVGATLKIVIKNDLWQGKMKTQIDGFLPK
jgi:hypothetical protein